MGPLNIQEFFLYQEYVLGFLPLAMHNPYKDMFITFIAKTDIQMHPKHNPWRTVKLQEQNWCHLNSGIGIFWT